MWVFAAQDGGGDERDEEADGKRLEEGVGHVDEGVLVELLRVLYGADLGGGGGGVEAGGLDVVDLRGEVAIHEMGHEVEVKDLPHDDVEGAGDKRDEEAAGEGAAEGDAAVEGVIAVGADAEVDEHEGRHHDGVAEHHAVCGAEAIGEEQ